MEICTNLGFFTKLLSIETINISLFAESKERNRERGNTEKRIVICLEKLIMQSFECGDFKEIEVSCRARGAHCT